MNPLMSEMANKARHEELLQEARRLRREQAAQRVRPPTTNRNTLAPRPSTLDRALAMLTSIITPW
jgi:hypothetical protein